MKTNEELISEFEIRAVIDALHGTDFDGFEIEPCRRQFTPQYDMTSDKEEFDEETIHCDDKDAEFWGVYKHLTEGGVDWVWDFPTRAQAETFVHLLELKYLNKIKHPSQYTVVQQHFDTTGK